MRAVKQAVCVVAMSFSVYCGASSTSHAAEAKSTEAVEEKSFYVGAFGGYSFLDNVGGHWSSNVVSSSDSTFKNGWSGGAKLGWVLPPVSYGRWFNWELEYWYQNMHVKQQNITATVPGLGSTQLTLSGANGHVHTFASNFILRRPTGIFQPYAGVGPSLVFVDVSGSPTTANSLGIGNTSALGFGLNLLAGTRIMFSKNLGVFAEYKRNWAWSLEFDGVRSDIYSNAVVGGLVWNFDDFWLP